MIEKEDERWWQYGGYNIAGICGGGCGSVDGKLNYLYIWNVSVYS